MNHHRNIAIGMVMVCIAITAPVILAYPLKLDQWWQIILLNVPFWALSWFGSVRATKGWLALRRDIIAMQQQEIQLLMDQYLKVRAELQ